MRMFVLRRFLCFQKLIRSRLDDVYRLETSKLSLTLINFYAFSFLVYQGVQYRTWKMYHRKGLVTLMFLITLRALSNLLEKFPFWICTEFQIKQREASHTDLQNLYSVKSILALKNFKASTSLVKALNNQSLHIFVNRLFNIYILQS